LLANRLPLPAVPSSRVRYYVKKSWLTTLSALYRGGYYSNAEVRVPFRYPSVYRQHCAQCSRRYLGLRAILWPFSGQFSSFIARRGDTLHRWQWSLAWRSGPKDRCCMPNFTPVSAEVGLRDPKTENFAEFYLFGI